MKTYIKLMLLNSNGTPEYFERGLDFEYNCKINDLGENLVCSPNIAVNNTSYIIKSESEIDLTCELSVSGALCKLQSHKVICSAEIKECECQTISEYPLYICSLAEEEDIWNVAKRYKKRVGDIARRNGLDSDCKTVCGKLII